MRKILVVIDMQNDFIDGPLGTPEAQAIVPKIVHKMKTYSGTDTDILFTKDTHYDNYLETQEGKNLPVEHCKFMTNGWSINKDIAAEFKVGDYFIYSSRDIINSRILKETFGSFKLIDLLKTIDFEEIELVGVCTDICVVSNAMLLKAAFPEKLITVDASCCAGVTPETHKAALTTMKMCQINVINEDEE